MTVPSGSSLVAAGLVVVAGGAAALVPAAAPAGAAGSRCPAGTGVTVVVDYGPLGGGVAVGCDPDGAGRPASQVVPAAGFDLSYVTNEPGFVCSIERRPDPARSCQRTPPADAYWGLFWSDGSSARWTYSSSGVGGLEVADGGSIGWRFQDGGDREDPGAPPTTRSEPKPTPKPQPTNQPSSRPSPQPSPRPSSSPSRQAPTTPTRSAPGEDQDTAAGPRTPAGRTPSGPRSADGRDRGRSEGDAEARARGRDLTSTGDPLTAAADGAVRVEEPLTEPLATEPDGSARNGSTMVTLGAVAVLAGLGAAAAVVARRRRTG